MPSSRKRYLLILVLILLLAATLAAATLAERRDLLHMIRQSELTIRWKTESDEDIVGYNLYRADSPGGRFVRVNRTLIAHDAQQPNKSGFTYVDENVVRGETYYYQLEIIYRQGREIRKGPYAITAD